MKLPGLNQNWIRECSLYPVNVGRLHGKPVRSDKDEVSDTYNFGNGLSFVDQFKAAFHKPVGLKILQWGVASRHYNLSNRNYGPLYNHELSVCRSLLGFNDFGLVLSSFPKSMSGKPKSEGKKRYNYTGQSDYGTLITVSSVDRARKSETDAQANLDGEEVFFAKGLICLIFLAILYAFLKRF